MNEFFKYFGLAFICCAFAFEYTKMSPDKIMLQVPMVIFGAIMFIEYLQKDIIESLIQSFKGQSKID